MVVLFAPATDDVSYLNRLQGIATAQPTRPYYRHLLPVPMVGWIISYCYRRLLPLTWLLLLFLPRDTDNDHDTDNTTSKLFIISPSTTTIKATRAR